MQDLLEVRDEKIRFVTFFVYRRNEKLSKCGEKSTRIIGLGQVKSIFFFYLQTFWRTAKSTAKRRATSVFMSTEMAACETIGMRIKVNRVEEFPYCCC